VPRGNCGAGRLEAVALTLSPRNRELAFLIVVGILTAIGFASVYIVRKSVVSTASLTYAAIFFGVFLGAHLVVRATVPFADPYLLPIAGLLSALGVTEIYRLHPNDAFKQGVWIIIGVALFAAVMFLLRHDYRRIESYKYLFGLTAIGLLLVPILPVLGQTVNGARLWVHVGSLQFQPGELAKIMLIVFLAGYLREKRELLAQGRLKDFGPLLAIVGMCILVLLETRDLGGGLLYFGIFLAMVYVATGRMAYVLAGVALFLVGSIGVWKVTPHVQERVTVWRHPWSSHPVYCPSAPGHLALRQNCQGYQIVQSLYSIAHGGYTGTGLGRGTVTTLGGTELIPYAKTDFIFSIIAQEVGLVGTAAFLLVYMVFVLRGMRIALLAQDGFSKLLALGLTFAFALQAFIIVGGILRLIPLTGITLPFVSYGGSSVVANFVLLAGLLLVSNRANRDVLR
jgi:cell division protein FtsW (lipid II flippase)